MGGAKTLGVTSRWWMISHTLAVSPPALASCECFELIGAISCFVQLRALSLFIEKNIDFLVILISYAIFFVTKYEKQYFSETCLRSSATLLMCLILGSCKRSRSCYFTPSIVGHTTPSRLSSWKSNAAHFVFSCRLRTRNLIEKKRFLYSHWFQI